MMTISYQLCVLYYTMAVLFFLSGCFWVYFLYQSQTITKIHYLMAASIFAKFLSLSFHSIDYYFVETLGVQLATWTILFYITRLLASTLLFTTLILVGSGWIFIKQTLATCEKRLLVIIIPLQVLANVAEIHSEKGCLEGNTWSKVYTLADMLCCMCILYPAACTVICLRKRKLSRIDNTAVNLQNLKLFRCFYFLLVCYIYLTRIVSYLLKISVPSQYEWLGEMVSEIITYVLFVVTGYMFRPAKYLSESSDDVEDLIISDNGLIEDMKRVNFRSQDKSTA